MEFVAYVHREDMLLPPKRASEGEAITLEVAADTAFGDAVTRALDAADKEVRGGYYRGTYRLGSESRRSLLPTRGRRWTGGLWFDVPVYAPLLLRNATDPDSGLLPFPRVAIGENGQFIWVSGARDRATFADYERARTAGFTEGDPYGVFLWRPLGGNGFIPGWEDLIRWLEEGVVVGSGAWFLGFVRGHLRRWQQRGATVPVAFLDIVLARDEWMRDDLARLLGVPQDEATKALTSLGFEPVDVVGQTRWVVSDDPDASSLRKAILRDFMHRHDD